MNVTKLVFGLAVIAAGLLFTFHNLDLLDADDYFLYWPVVLIAIGLANLFGAKRQQLIFAITMIGLGLWILLYNLEYIDLEPWPFFWPVVLVLVGANLVMGALRRSTATADADEVVNSFALWSGIERNLATPNFRGGDLTAIMGAAEIDLTASKIADEPPTLHVFAFWGGIDVKVPKEWRVDFRVLPLLAGASDETQPPGSDQAPTLVIKGMAIMGGVDVTN